MVGANISDITNPLSKSVNHITRYNSSSPQKVK
jgi:hypothetical protein